MSNCATFPFKLVQHAVVHHARHRQGRSEVRTGWRVRWSLPLWARGAGLRRLCHEKRESRQVCSICKWLELGSSSRRFKKKKRQKESKKERKKSGATLQLFCVNTRIFAGSISQEGRGGAAAMDHPAENFSENIPLLREHSVISR